MNEFEEERALLETFITTTVDTNHPISNYTLALRDARQLAGRDPESGKPIGPFIAKWPAALNYLVLLELIGKTLTYPSAPNNGDRLEAAIARFHPGGPNAMSGRAKNCLYSLRSAFAHAYGLVSIPSKGNNDPCRRFYLSDQPVIDFNENTLIPTGVRDWDGQLDSIGPDSVTHVSVTAIVALAEAIVDNIEQRHASSELRVHCDDYPTEQIKALRLLYFVRVFAS